MGNPVASIPAEKELERSDPPMSGGTKNTVSHSSVATVALAKRSADAAPPRSVH
jgi:hypothetical protein